MLPVTDFYTAIAKYSSNNIIGINGLLFENEKGSFEAPFIRITFNPITNVNREIGSGGKNRFDCILVIDVFTGEHLGIGEGSDLISSLSDIFKLNTKITTDEGNVITFLVPDPLQGRPDGFNYYQSTIHCPWYTYYNK